MSWHAGGCHCGAVAFEVQAADEIELVDCNCSMCRKTGYLHLIVPKSRFRLLRGADTIATYTFNTGAAKHMFCSLCGIKSFYVPRSHPDGYSVNFRCLDGAAFKSVVTTEFDGSHWERNAGQLAPLEETR
ncbi:MAG: GFA family protein [Rhizomicrobium sp.]